MASLRKISPVLLLTTLIGCGGSGGGTGRASEPPPSGRLAAGTYDGTVTFHQFTPKDPDLAIGSGPPAVLTVDEDGRFSMTQPFELGLDGTADAEGAFAGTYHYRNFSSAVHEPVTGILVATRTGGTLTFTTYFNGGNPQNGSRFTVQLVRRK